MTDFDMPPASAGFDKRAGWVVRRLCADLDLTQIQAAGLVGNLGFESGGFATLQEIAPAAGGRGGYGWAQWTGLRRVAFETWCNAQKLDPASDQANYGYLLIELRGAYAATVAAVKKQTTLAAAVFSVGQTYERPGGITATNLPGYAGRLDYAQRALTAAGTPAAAVIKGPVLPDADKVAAQPAPADLQRQAKLSIPDAIAALQSLLTTAGFDAGPADGIYGPRTVRALQAYNASL